jgi:glycosyltransferase involved in cell wall biosynthesis
MQNPTILLIGNHFRSKKAIPIFGMNFLIAFKELAGRQSSPQKSAVASFGSLTWCGRSCRKRYQIAEVDVFSGPSFLWVELSVIILKIIKKPIILTLHGGNLPEFAEKHTKRVQRVLASADAVVAPSAYLQTHLAQFRKDIHIIPNPIDKNAFPFRHRTQPRGNLVWVRAFHEVYNPSLAPAIIDSLRRNFPDIFI